MTVAAHSHIEHRQKWRYGPLDMITPTIEVKFNHLPAMTPVIHWRAAEVVEGAAFACEALAKSIAPIDTGFLRSSIQAQPETPLSWIVAVGADYGKEVEFGTSRQAAQPYMTPASENVRPTFLGQMQRIVEEAAR